jgi:hypothetical protein
MKALLEEAIRILEEEKNILWVWVDQINSHWSKYSSSQFNDGQNRISSRKDFVF